MTHIQDFKVVSLVAFGSGELSHAPDARLHRPRQELGQELQRSISRSVQWDHKRMSWQGLYAITDAALTRDRGLVACVEAVLRGGAAMVQYRDKHSSPDAMRRNAGALLAACREAAVPLIINDDVGLAQAIGADGVHVGRDDEAVAAARAALGADAIIGASCYHHLELAEQAAAAGASYVAFGRFFDSVTKPGAALATPGLLRKARSRLSLPIAAIGGITADNGGALVRDGADLLAVINDLWGAPDCAARARDFAACFRGPSRG